MNDIVIVKGVLESGGVVMHPTETCYGFAVDVYNESALEKLKSIKGREDKPFSILVDGLPMAQKFGIFSKKALDLAQRYWPGPLSILVPRSEELPDFFNPGVDFVSIRCSSDDFTRMMVWSFGRPVTTTSANVSGQEPLYEANTTVFGEKAMDIDFVIDGGRIPRVAPSTIVKVVGDKIEILRQGPILIEDVD